jgi:predicted membrane channel-forming protein YqfA (hemolysin III family)
MIIKRRPYADNEGTPLMRGVVISLFGFAYTSYIIFWRHYYDWSMLFMAFSNIFCYTLSFIYHCIPLSRTNEKRIEIIDHIGINLHILGNIIPFMHFPNMISLVILQAINFVIDTYRSFQVTDYCTSVVHRIHQSFGMMIALIASTYVYFSLTSMSSIMGLIMVLYIGSEMNWLLFRKSHYHDVWGPHETMHLCIVIADSVMWMIAGIYH